MVAGEIASEVDAGRTLEAAAATYGVSKAGPFSRRDFVPGVGRANEFIGASFGLRAGETSGVVKTENPERYYVIRVDERRAADGDAFAAQAQDLKQELARQEQVEVFSSWIQNLVDEADIEDYREMYF